MPILYKYLSEPVETPDAAICDLCGRKEPIDLEAGLDVPEDYILLMAFSTTKVIDEVVICKTCLERKLPVLWKFMEEKE